jgi:hypothetical protein
LYAQCRALGGTVTRNPDGAGLILDMAALTQIAQEPAPRSQHLTLVPPASVDREERPAAGDSPVSEVLNAIEAIVPVVAGDQPAVVAQAVVALRACVATLSELVGDPRTSRGTRGSNIGSAVFAGLAESEEQTDRAFSKQRATKSLSLSSLPARPRSVADPDADPVGGDQQKRLRSSSELDELLHSLIDLSKRATPPLVGITNRQRLAEALAPYSNGQVRHAARKIGPMVSAGSVHSPFGLLIAMAETADADFFPAAEAETTEVATPPLAAPRFAPPLEPGRVVEAEVSEDEEPGVDLGERLMSLAEGTISAMEQAPGNYSPELAKLDEHIRRSLPAGEVEARPGDGVGLHSERVRRWEELCREAAEKPVASPGGVGWVGNAARACLAKSGATYEAGRAVRVMAAKGRLPTDLAAKLAEGSVPEEVAP